MMIPHNMQDSGNSYKVRLAARQLGIPLVLKEYPLRSGKTRQPEFLAKNPNGRVPLLELEDGRCLAASDAILWYLTNGTALQPSDAWSQAQALQWMFFEQYKPRALHRGRAALAFARAQGSAGGKARLNPGMARSRQCSIVGDGGTFIPPRLVRRKGL
jgi:glutathione S-transferase